MSLMLSNGIDRHGGMIADGLLADLGLSCETGASIFDGRDYAPRRGMELGGRWLLLRELGQGARAVVFECVDLDQVPMLGPDAARLPRWAVKIARPATDAQTELTHEASLLRRAAGIPGIVETQSVETTDEHVFLRTSIAPGQRLPAILAGRAADHGLPKHLWRHVLGKLAECLARLHDRGIVHGDVKPGNVVATVTPGPVHLIDFGAASTPDQTGSNVRLTPTWSRPERLTDHRPNVADDTFSLAMLCHRLIDGRHPFGGIPAAQSLAGGFARPRLRGGPRRLRLVVDHVLTGGLAGADEFSKAIGLGRTVWP